MFRVGYPERRVRYPPYPRESATLQSTLQDFKADAHPGEARTGPRPAAEFWKAHDAHKAAGSSDRAAPLAPQSQKRNSSPTLTPWAKKSLESDSRAGLVVLTVLPPCWKVCPFGM